MIVYICIYLFLLAQLDTGYLTTIIFIPQARMGSESIAHEAKG